MSALREAIHASRNARLVHDENQQELVAIPVKDWEAIEGVLTYASNLVGIGRLLATQDNRATSDPIFVVQQKVAAVADEEYNAERIEWARDDSDHTAADEEQAAELEAEYQASFVERPGWRRVPMRDDWQFVTACFTQKGCEDYLRVNGHNLREPRIYVESGFRNAEWQLLRAFLLLLAKPKGVSDGA